MRQKKSVVDILECNESVDTFFVHLLVYWKANPTKSKVLYGVTCSKIGVHKVSLLLEMKGKE